VKPDRIDILPLRQLKFGFDQQDKQHAAEVLARIDGYIANAQKVVVSDLMVDFGCGSKNWSKERISMLLSELIHDDKIEFEFENIKIGKKEALRLLLKPSQCEAVGIVHAQIVADEDLIAARKLVKLLLGTEAPPKQNELCRILRKHLNGWKNDLEKFKRLADTGKFPGNSTIDAVRKPTERLLALHEPYRFIDAINRERQQLLNVSKIFIVLKEFYTVRIHVWYALVEALDAFRSNLSILQKDPRSETALQELCRIFHADEPFGLLDNVFELIATVKTVNDEIVLEQTTAARDAAHEKIEKMIQCVRCALDNTNAQRELRNRALYPLQGIKKGLGRANSLTSIEDLLNHAQDKLDLSLDHIDEITSVR